MSGIEVFLSQPAARATGWALLHFVWQGALLAALAALALRCLRGASPQARYGTGCAAMLLMLAAPVLTAARVYDPTPPGPLDGAVGALGAVPVTLAALPVRERVEILLPWLVALWLAGTLVLSVRLAGGWSYARGLGRQGARPAPAAWQARLHGLARRMRVARPVRLLESARVPVPMVVGWLRPVVLLPLAATTGLTPAQLEAILLHELAHVRRHDYLVNLLQSAVETLLFYHPGVWWLSRRIREERELCCDDAAVAACGDALGYARALTQLEGLRPPAPALALAATGGPLLRRIRRLVLPSPRPAAGPAAPVASAVFLLLVAATVAAAAQLSPARVAAESATAVRAVVADAVAGLPGPGNLPGAPSARGGEEVRRPVRPRAVGKEPAVSSPPPRDTLLVPRIRAAAAERSETEQVRRLVELAHVACTDPAATDAYLDAVQRIPSESARRRALSAAMRAGGPARTAASSLGTAPSPTRSTRPPASSARAGKSLRPAERPTSGLDARLDALERSSASPRERRDALSALLREQAPAPR